MATGQARATMGEKQVVSAELVCKSLSVVPCKLAGNECQWVTSDNAHALLEEILKSNTCLCM